MECQGIAFDNTFSIDLLESKVDLVNYKYIHREKPTVHGPIRSHSINSPV